MAYDINSALERLEQNLKNVDSARKQVESVVSSSKELQEIVKSYADSLNSMYGDLKEWEGVLATRSNELSEAYTQSLDNVNTSCQSIITSFKKMGDTVSTQIQQDVQGSLKELDKCNQTLATTISGLSTLNADFKKATTDVLFMKEDLSAFYTELKSSQREQDKVLADVKASVENFPELLDSSKKDINKVLGDIKAGVDRLPISLNEQTTNILAACSDIKKIANSIEVTSGTLITKVDGLSKTTDAVSKKTDSLKSQTESEFKTIREEMGNYYEKLVKMTNINKWLLIAGVILVVVLKLILFQKVCLR